MQDFEIKEVITNNIEQELANIGFDSAYRNQAGGKYRYKNFKVFGLNPAQANILKQTALTVGADCATHREVITGKIESSDVIIGGSYSELRKIAEKLKYQPFSLGILGQKIVESLETKISKTKLVGILNITPDSFSDGGKYIDSEKACVYFEQLIKDGADIIDIGAESTRPGFEPVSAEEQIKRLKPILEFAKQFDIPKSLDTRNADVAKFGLENGISIINDVSGLEYDTKMADVIAEYNAGVVIQHSQKEALYDNLIEEIFFSLKKKAGYVQEKGVQNIILDVGLGFGKTKEQNFGILDRIQEFQSLNLPLMVGISRKSFLGVEADDNMLKDSLSLALAYPLMQKSVDYLRVHNVKLHKQLLSQVF